MPCGVKRVEFIMLVDDENQFLMSRALWEVPPALMLFMFETHLTQLWISGNLFEKLLQEALDVSLRIKHIFVPSECLQVVLKFDTSSSCFNRAKLILRLITFSSDIDFHVSRTDKLEQTFDSQITEPSY